MSELKGNNEEITKEEKDEVEVKEKGVEQLKEVAVNENKVEQVEEKTVSDIAEQKGENLQEEIEQVKENTLKNKFEESLKEKESEEKQKNMITEKSLSNDLENKKKEEKAKNTNKESSQVENKRHKRGIAIGIITGIVLVLLGIFSTCFAFFNINNENIYKNIFIDGIDVSNMSVEEAKDILEKDVNEKLIKSINIKIGEEVKSVTLEELEVEFDVQSALNTAYSIGKDGNIFTNNFAILNQNFNKKNIEIPFKISDDKLEALIADLQKDLPNRVVNFNTEIDGNNLIVTKGKKGFKINSDEFKNVVCEKIKDYDEVAIEIPVQEVEPESITAEELRELIYKEPKNAYYEKEPKFVIYPHEVGVDFAGTIEEVSAILSEDKEEYIIPLKLTNPQVLTSDIGNEAFPDLLATFSTKYNPSNADRSENMRLASNKINGTVVLPGETFSYNKVVGKRTVEAGYKEAAVYVSGKVVNGIGGGICQVSSTLYNSVLLANLDIVERRNHQFTTSYVDAGRDATVSYGTIDFQFKNNRQYPIKVMCYVKNGVCKVDIYGIKQDDDYEVKITTKLISTIPVYTEYEDTASLKVGQTKKKQTGSAGAITETYRTLLRNGAVISTELLSKDRYNVLPQIILRGTASSSVVQTPAETTPEPTVPTVTTPTTPDITTPSEPSGNEGSSTGTDESGSGEGTSTPEEPEELPSTSSYL